MSLKKEVITVLEDMADLMEFRGENRFKINAFRNGANVLRQLEKDLAEMIENNELKEVKGIGKGLQTVIKEYYETGVVNDYIELRASIPEGMFEIFSIRGLGVKKVKQINEELSISNLQELEQACKDDKIAATKGFGRKTQEKILAEIDRITGARGKILLHKAIQLGNEIISELKNIDSVSDIQFTGELRRSVETLSKVELILIVKEKTKFQSELKEIYDYELLSEGIEFFTLKFLIESKIVFLYCVTEESAFHRIQFRLTGSDKFLHENNFSKLEKEFKTEQEIFDENNMNFVIPEMREHEYFAAPENLQTNSDLELNKFKGLLHFHTTDSDGLNTLEEMTDEASKIGFKYLAVCDHSKSAFYANGLNEERILLQNKHIKVFNSNSDLKVYHGIESDILRNGNLDYDLDILKIFDFVVASVHSNFGMSEEDMTQRIITAIENENTDLLGHPTGRLLLSRAPYKVNINKIIDACSRNDVAIEINANPNRLDLDWRHIYYAREKGCLFSINPDAHSTSGIHDINFGIKIARKGGLQSSEVINCFSKSEFEKFLNRKIKRKFN
ncbi:MAG: PHP domain-containing protein [Melioribacteraceae bacterium]|nr:PHP domain-containing protein [Melioribacteraceae bacterium]MCF8353440.1 PHP domain-containing protein [Melioribacteraceae bacterium]MCF8393928.1 PHP domain-containing protein [Melioribacteraceae bacterium]MCF8419001.1 PHP domain-containing protein [Melioribacteraceae bacterium]